MKKCEKPLIKDLYNVIKYDVRSNTGSNIRNTTNLLNADSFDQITISHLNDIRYKDVNNSDLWKIDFLKELIRSNLLFIEHFVNDEITDIINFICTV